MKRIINIFIFFILILEYQSFGQTVKRSRNEGTMAIPASNVLGNGNITAYTIIDGDYYSTDTTREFEATARMGAQLGIAQILQIQAQTSFINFRHLGSSEVHLQVTTPHNDNLRFFGAAVRGDLYLSTSIDTLQSESDSNKPEYNPYPLFSCIMDLDFIARSRELPIKTYLFVGFAENPRLLYEYNQICIKTGVEWKLNQSSFFTDLGIGLYKYKHLPPPKKASYNQYFSWISPGFRYKLRKRFSIIGSLRWTFFRKLVSLGSLNPEQLNASIMFEAPIVFKETNGEAIRTLIFIEKNKKNEDKSRVEHKESLDSTIHNTFENTFFDLKLDDGTFDYRKEKDELGKQREKIQEKMKEIEKLLEE